MTQDPHQERLDEPRSESAVTTEQPPHVPPPEGFLDTAVGVLSAPVATMRRLTVHPRVGWAIGLTVGLAVLSTLAGAPGIGEAAPGAGITAPAGLDGLGGVILAGSLILGPLFALGLLAAWSGILHGLARLLGGVGIYSGAFTGVAFASVPQALGIPFQLLPQLAGPAGAVISSLVSFALTVWMAVLTVIAVREGHGITTGRAVAAFVIPLAALLLLVVLFVVLVGAALFAALPM